MDSGKLRWFCGSGMFLISVLSTTVGLQVSIPQSTYEVARGDPVTIPCSFTPKNPVNNLIIITWFGDPDGSFDDEGISFGTFYSNDNHVDIDPMYEGKVDIETDTNTKVSNLVLKQVTLRESRRIKCRVQIPGDDTGQTVGSTNLVVLVAPSEPVCKIKGTAEYYYNITLNCESDEGSPAPTYQWQSYDAKNNLRSFPAKTTEKDGVLSLFNISADTSGYYICTATNKIRSAKCNLTLAVMPSTMNIGATAGIIGGCIAGLAILVVIIYCCCKDKEKPDEISTGPPVIEYIKTPIDEKEEIDPGHMRKTSIESYDQREKYEVKVELQTTEDSDRNSNRRFDGRPDDLQEDFERKEPYSRDRYDDRSDRYDDRRDRYEDRSERYDDRKDRDDDQRDRSDDRSERHEDRRDRFDDRQNRYNDRKYRSDERLDRNDDRRYRSDERLDRHDERRYRSDERLDRPDDRRDRYNDDQDRYHDRRDRYDERRDRYNDRQDRYDDRY